jgi:hypothetical protein
MDETYHDRWPRWTDRDYYAVRALLNGAATLQATGQEPKP